MKGKFIVYLNHVRWFLKTDVNNYQHEIMALSRAQNRNLAVRPHIINLRADRIYKPRVNGLHVVFRVWSVLCIQILTNALLPVLKDNYVQ